MNGSRWRKRMKRTVLITLLSLLPGAAALARDSEEKGETHEKEA
jgi:hypothetical protein